MSNSQQVTAYPFTPAEFERLYAFKQAVSAGFFSDELPEATATAEQIEMDEAA